MVPVALRSFTLRNFIEDQPISSRHTRGGYCEALRFATSLRKWRHPARDWTPPHCEALRFATSLRMVGDEVETGRLRDCEALRFATSLRSEGPHDPGTGRRLRSFTLRNFIEELGCRRIKQPGHHCEALRFATSLRKHESMAVIIAMARLRSFTLRNFIEDATIRRMSARRHIAKLYASQLH